MKMKLKYWGALIICLGMLPLTSNAILLDLSNALGRVVDGVAANATADEAMVNAIIARANGVASTYDVAGKTYTVLNDPAPLLPSFASFVSGGAVGGDNQVNLGLGGYEYLSIKYDGAQGSLLIWDIASLTGIVDVLGTDLGKGANNYNLFNASRTPTGVPDGGMTVMLLGAGLSVLGIGRRLVKI